MDGSSLGEIRELEQATFLQYGRQIAEGGLD
jgi:hypothetical protein